MSQLNQEKQRIVDSLDALLHAYHQTSGQLENFARGQVIGKIRESLDTLHAAVVREVESKGIEVQGLKVERGELWIALPRAAEKIKKFFVIDAESLAPNKDKEE